MYSHFGDTSVYSCDLCGIILKDIEELEWHIGEEHNHQWTKCLFTFNNKNDYVGTWQQWQYHMLTEHELRTISVLGMVTQWTFRISLPASNETASPSHLLYCTSTMENKKDDNGHDGDINMVYISNA